MASPVDGTKAWTWMTVRANIAVRAVERRAMAMVNFGELGAMVWGRIRYHVGDEVSKR